MPHIFISYVSENLELVHQLADELKTGGFEIWLDRDQIMPGERWENAIKKAIQEGDFFIACFSKEYWGRGKTYMNRELMWAIEEIQLRSTSRTWFIPVLLSECQVPEKYIDAKDTILSFQHVELYKNWSDGVKRILSVIRKDKPIKVNNTLVIDFSKDFDPPAPIVRVKISTDLPKITGRGSDATIETKMLIDTGADMSVIPKKSVKELEAKTGLKIPYDYQTVEDFNGDIFSAKSYRLKLQNPINGIGDGKMITFLESKADEGLLGRDVLNGYQMTLTLKEQNPSSSSSGFKQIKRKALEDRRVILVKKYEAANQQFNSTLDASDKITIQQKITSLEKEIESVETEINQL